MPKSANTNSMRQRLKTAGLLEIADKVEARERLSFVDAVTLFASTDLLALGWIANRERERRHGDRTYFNHNLRLEATNVCEASCLFCSFARLKEGDPGSHTMSLEQIFAKLRQRADQPLTEIHIVIMNKTNQIACKIVGPVNKTSSNLIAPPNLNMNGSKCSSVFLGISDTHRSGSSLTIFKPHLRATSSQF